MLRMEVTERPETLMNLFNYKAQEATNLLLEGHLVEGEYR